MLVGAPSAVEAKDTMDRRGASYITLSNTSRVMESVLRVHSSGTYTGTKSSKREKPSIHRAVFFSFLFLLLLGWLTPHKVYIAQIGARGTGCFESRENYRKMRDFYHRQENGNSSRALAATQKKRKIAQDDARFVKFKELTWGGVGNHFIFFSSLKLGPGRVRWGADGADQEGK